MITLETYWAGRDTQYADECTDEIQSNAAETVRRVNKLLALAALDDIVRDKVSSGWRPQSVNDATANAAHGSKHLTAQACDVQDLNRIFAQWCINNLDKVADCELWLENPRWTPTWLHAQTVPPLSGKRVFIPSTAAPIAPPLEGQT